MILDEVKAALRIKGDLFDTVEIEPLIEACKTDLRLAGANKILDSDPLPSGPLYSIAKQTLGMRRIRKSGGPPMSILSARWPWRGTIDEDGP